MGKLQLCIKSPRKEFFCIEDRTSTGRKKERGMRGEKRRKRKKGEREEMEERREGGNEEG